MTPSEMSESSFDAGARATPHELRRQIKFFTSDQISRHLLDAIPTLLAIVNRQRQVVFANRQLLHAVGAEEEALTAGKRPGELLSCLHSADDADGCGAGEVCRTCGAALALFMAGEGEEGIQECRISRIIDGRLEALDLEVWATPFQFKGETFTVFALTDVSHKKRRSVMEKLFFHDVLNVIGSIRGFAELLKDYDPRDKQEIYSLIHIACQQVIDQVVAHRTLVAAEQNELKVNYEPLSLYQFLDNLADIYRHHDLAGERLLKVERPRQDLHFQCDRVLLSRIVGNMLVNAFEAVSAGEQVTLGGARDGDKVLFWVHNPGEIPHAVKLQIFKRSFSTKGTGRGLGTYSLKLLSGFLQGDVSFTSRAGDGTRFEARYPLKL